MSDKTRKQKEIAGRLIAKGRLAEAAAEYEKIVRVDRQDLTARQKLAELYAETGQTERAVAEYQGVVGSYAADGLLLKAIAVCKIILQVDPSHTETQAILAELSTRRRGEAHAVEIPKSMSAAITSEETRGAPSRENPAGARVWERARGELSALFGHAGMAATEDFARVAARSAAIASIEAPLYPRPEPTEMPADDLVVEVGFTSGEGAPVDIGDVIEVINAGEPIVIGAFDEVEPLEELPPDEPLEPEEAIDQVAALEPAIIEVDKLPSVPLFSDLPRDAFIALTEQMELRIAGKGDVLVREGSTGTSMFIIIQGTVTVTRRGLDGVGDVALAELSDGAFFGEMALLSDVPRMATVVCKDDVMVFEISRDLLSTITRAYPTVDEVMRRFHKNRLITNLLKTSPIFQPFSAKDKKALIERFKSRSVDEGAYVITREHPGEGLYLLLSGRCEVLDGRDTGDEALLAELKEGDVFGEMSMLWNKKTCASVRARTPCVVLRLGREEFREIIMTHPQVLEVLTELSERRRQQNDERSSAPVAFIV